MERLLEGAPNKDRFRPARWTLGGAAIGAILGGWFVGPTAAALGLAGGGFAGLYFERKNKPK